MVIKQKIVLYLLLIEIIIKVFFMVIIGIFIKDQNVMLFYIYIDITLLSFVHFDH